MEISLFFSDALSEACDRRKLELNSLDAFLDTGKKALQLSGTDTQSLGGRHLIICGNKAFVQISVLGHFRGLKAD